MEDYGRARPAVSDKSQCLNGWSEVECNRCKTRASPLDAIRRPRDTPVWKLEASLKCRSCRKARWTPPVRMIKLTEAREITPSGCIRMRRGGEFAGFTPSGIAQCNGRSRVGTADFNFRVLSGPTGSNWRPSIRRGPRWRRRNPPPTWPKSLPRLGQLILGARLRRLSRSVWSGFRPDVSEIAFAAPPLRVRRSSIRGAPTSLDCR